MTLFFALLLLLSVLCFGAAAVRKYDGHVNLVALGLLFFAAVPFIQTLQNL